MKPRTYARIFIMSLFLIFFFACESDDSDPAPGECDDVMINSLGTLFRDSIYADVTVEELISYGPHGSDQVMNVYQPVCAVEMERPLLVIAGGGGWNPSALGFLDAIGHRMAKAGWVVAGIRYFSDPGRLMDSTDASMLLRGVTAAQDINAAIRFFRRDGAEGNTYKVDPDNIFRGGFGTGAFVNLLGYFDASDVDQATLDFVNANGGFEGDWRGNAGYSSEVNGTVSMAGHINELVAIDAGDMPIIAIHSVNDPEVPYAGALNMSGDSTWGSQRIIHRAMEIGLPSELVSIPGSDHDAPSQHKPGLEAVLEFFYPLIVP